MAITLVQKGSVVQPTTQPSVSSGSGANNLLVCVLTYSTSPVPAVTTANWSRAVTVSASGATSEIWYLPGASNAGGITSITLSNWTGAANTGNGAQLMEFSGVVTSSPLDQTGTNSTGTSTVTTSGNLTANHELAVSVLFFISNEVTSAINLTSGSGFTSSGNVANGTQTTWTTAGDSFAILYDYDLDTGSSSGTTVSDAAGHDQGSWIIAQVIATFPQPAGGPQLGPPLLQRQLPNFPVSVVSSSGWRNAGHSR